MLDEAKAFEDVGSKMLGGERYKDLHEKSDSFARHCAM
jgi:hypothetical protein